jgi:hypothetical protein
VEAACNDSAQLSATYNALEQQIGSLVNFGTYNYLGVGISWDSPQCSRCVDKTYVPNVKLASFTLQGCANMEFDEVLSSSDWTKATSARWLCQSGHYNFQSYYLTFDICCVRDGSDICQTCPNAPVQYFRNSLLPLNTLHHRNLILPTKARTTLSS